MPSLPRSSYGSSPPKIEEGDDGAENESEMNDWNVTTEPRRESETTGMREPATAPKEKGTTGFPTRRPWRSYLELEKGPTYQVKHIEVHPGMRLSEQLHRHRSGHWVILQGTAKMTIDGAEQIVQPNESLFIPANARHSWRTWARSRCT
jgi:mannose-6-phosphate isomerase-like protein (cupin superfamily)